MKFYGKGVGGGIAIGKISFLETEKASVRRYRAQDAAAESARFCRALEEAEKELLSLCEKAKREAGQESAAILEIHAMMVRDDDFFEYARELIERERVNAEYAVWKAGEHFAATFAEMEDKYMRERSADVRDVSRRIISHLSGKSNFSGVGGENVIIFAQDIPPSFMLSLDKSRVLGIVAARGTENSHTAILACSMNIPTVVGAGELIVSRAKNGMTAALDAAEGEVYLEPDEQTVSALREKQREYEANEARLLSLRGKENVTLDGRKIDIFANIDGEGSIRDALECDAGGIGLFRSEFLYLEKNKLPSEEEQFEEYRRVLEGMTGRKVVIRTFDIGADKNAPCFELEKEENPALGVRGIRLGLLRRDAMKTQLRALYRASAYGKLAVMFPMISTAFEVEDSIALCEEVKRELAQNGVPYDENMEIGVMIETPAAAIMSEELARHVDFFSIGTNDLTQYTLACDRQNPRLLRYFERETHYEAVMRLVDYAAQSAHKHGAWIGVCGSLAANTDFTEVFLHMGVDELSVPPAAVLKIREKVRSIRVGGE